MVGVVRRANALPAAKVFLTFVDINSNGLHRTAGSVLCRPQRALHKAPSAAVRRAQAEPLVVDQFVVVGWIVDRTLRPSDRRIEPADRRPQRVGGDDGVVLRLDERHAGVEQFLLGVETSSVVRWPTLRSSMTPERTSCWAETSACAASIWARAASSVPQAEITV